eukprot:CAMPEP_0116104606 /NCGR_PEP_ID=MMETSP0327-20121206/14552_1 /TAXON_ID=44447 /ORGANISM="Pseudo-nitzschia delicatissima, Strain B596" /LENGTH=199 /DNA_ID=CAMNT_0003596883 /DNA_START=224 /DNA_END=823 /DNA_ORIENTATION=+
MTASVSTHTILWKSVHLFSLLLLLIITNVSTGFVTPTISSARVHQNTISPVFRTMTFQHRMSKGNDSVEKSDEDDNEEEEDDYLQPVFAADVRGRPAGVVLEDLDWRVAKLRLEEANKRRFLKSGPRFLPYVEAQKWVQAWGERWTSAEEWNEWIESGEKRNSYIPSRPHEYYTRTGDWTGWEDFLGVKTKDDESKNTE